MSINSLPVLRKLWQTKEISRSRVVASASVVSVATLGEENDPDVGTSNRFIMGDIDGRCGQDGAFIASPGGLFLEDFHIWIAHPRATTHLSIEGHADGSGFWLA